VFILVVLIIFVTGSFIGIYNGSINRGSIQPKGGTTCCQTERKSILIPKIELLLQIKYGSIKEWPIYCNILGLSTKS
jgi:hypothetical protein